MLEVASCLDHGKFFNKAPRELLKLVKRVLFTVEHGVIGPDSETEENRTATQTSVISRVVEATMSADGALQELKFLPPRHTMGAFLPDPSIEIAQRQSALWRDMQLAITELPPGSWLLALRNCLGDLRERPQPRVIRPLTVSQTEVDN